MKHELIVKSNVILQHSLYKTSIELKLFSKVVLAIRNNPEKEAHTFPVRELITDFGCHKDEYERLKKIAKSMFRVIDLNPSEKFFHLSAIFTDIHIHEEGVITFEVNKNVKPFLLNLTCNYTKYYFENIAKLKSCFSIRIYEFLKQYDSIGFRKTTLIELRRFLNISDDKFKNFNDFKRKVLLFAQKELKEKTDISFEFEEIKLGRKFNEIKFIILKNNDFIEFEAGETAVDSVLSSVKEELKKKLISDYGVTEKTAHNLVVNVSIEKIEKNIAHTEKEYKSGRIKTNITGYLLMAIKDDYAGNVVIFSEQEKIKQREEEKIKQLAIKKEKLIESLSKKFSKQEREQFLAELTEQQHQTLLNEILEEVKLDTFTFSQVKKNGLNTPIVYFLITKRIEGFLERKELFVAEELKKAGF